MKGLEEQLQIILEKAIETAEKTGEFIIEQAPLLLQEFYRWHITKHIFIMLIGISSLVFLIILGKKVRKMYNDEDYWDTPAPFFHFTAIIPTLLIIAEIYKLLFIIIAPKLYLIEYFIK